jgi:Mce-associated membrane protein
VSVDEKEDLAVEEHDVAPIDQPGDEAGEPTSTELEPEKRKGPVRRVLGVLRAVWVPLLLALLLLASAGLTAWLYFVEYRVDQQTDEAAANVAVKEASDGTVALLSYSPDTLDGDFAKAKTHLTGDFLNYYNQFTTQIVTPAAKQKQVKTSAVIVHAAVSELHPNSAVVLVFLNQSTMSKDNPDGSFTASSVKVGLTKVDGKWLISSFDPV